MSFLNWNYLGLGNHRTLNALKEVIMIKDPNIVFLMETKSDRDWLQKVRDRCGFKQGLIVPSVGNSGGLALFWKNELQVNVIKYSLSNIDVEVNSGDAIGWWHLTGFYLNPDTACREESWSRLKYLSSISQLPWLVIGVFNKLTGLSEKEGGATGLAQQMQHFVDTLS